MSLLCINHVLNSSRHSGTELLMLMVLADYSDDNGSSYPAVKSLARKCRMSSRNVNYILRDLQKSGELIVLKNDGPRGTNRYRIMLSALRGPQPVKPASPLKVASPLKPTTVTPESGFRKPLKPASDEPSLNRHEPSPDSKSRAKNGETIPVCPHRELIALFTAAVPELPHPRPEAWGGRRKSDMRGRWQWVLTAKRESGARYATTAQEALAWFGKFFENVAASSFLTGRNGRWTRCDLAWLMTLDNFFKIIENKYTDAEAPV